jgi:hypothetical protein
VFKIFLRWNWYKAKKRAAITGSMQSFIVYA